MQKSIEKFVKFPIATTYEEGEPRLLVVSVDATEGTTVTFDSYEKGKDKWQRYSKNGLLWTV